MTEELSLSKEETQPKRPAKALPLEQIVASLKDLQRSQFTKETEWSFEKSQMTHRITQLEGTLRAQENINEDLVKRITMLEFCLREERIKYARVMQNQEGGEDIVGTALKKANLNATLYERIAKRRAKAQRPLLLK